MSGRTLWLKRFDEGYELFVNGGRLIHSMCMDFEWILGVSLEVGQKQRVRFSVEPVGKVIEPKRFMQLGDITRGTGRPWFTRWPGERDNNPFQRDGFMLGNTLAQHIIQARHGVETLSIGDIHDVEGVDPPIDWSGMERAERFAFLYGTSEPWPEGGTLGIVHPDGRSERVQPTEIRSDRVLSEPILTPVIAVREDVYQDIPTGRHISQIRWGGQPNRIPVVYGRSYGPAIPEEGEW